MIKVENVAKHYRMDGIDVEALCGVSFKVDKGEFVSLVGPSGSGKSTLMNILGCLDTPTGGDYYLNGKNVAHLGDDELAVTRNRELGFIFQSHNLLPRNTLLENVSLPLYYRGEKNPLQQAKTALETVGLDHRMDHFPSQVSGGESQRTAIARAIVTKPNVILADEPTGNLDTKTGEMIIRILGDLNETGVTLVMVTHDMNLAKKAGRRLNMRDGLLI